METRMLLQDESLWDRIQKFSLDEPGTVFPFSKKLAKEENWSLDFTRRAIDEYKKFIYLCCILPNGASPSKTVDKVWHMHLIYTQNYWEVFCPDILKRKLHHHPSKGGQTEASKHRNWFNDTLNSYREVFSSEAPEDIWLQKKDNRWQKFRIIPLLASLLLMTSCLGEIISTLTSIFFSLLVAFIFGGLIGIFRNSNEGNGGDSGIGCGGSSCGGGGCGGGCGGCGGCGG